MLEDVAQLDAEGSALLRQACETLQLSARGFHRTLKVARTLADLDGVGELVDDAHVAMALQLRVRLGVSSRERAA